MGVVQAVGPDTQGLEAEWLKTDYHAAMKHLCWTLILLATAAFVVGTFLAFMKTTYLLEPYGYWRGSMGLLLFAIAIRLMDDRKA